MEEERRGEKGSKKLSRRLGDRLQALRRQGLMFRGTPGHDNECPRHKKHEIVLCTIKNNKDGEEFSGLYSQITASSSAQAYPYLFVWAFQPQVTSYSVPTDRSLRNLDAEAHRSVIGHLWHGGERALQGVSRVLKIVLFI